MEHKILKMHWATWISLRHTFPGKYQESMNDYIKRIVRRLNDGKNNKV